MSGTNNFLRVVLAVEDNQCSSKTNDSISKINDIVLRNERLSIRMITEMITFDKETAIQILDSQLHMTKICTKMVPKTFFRELFAW